MTPAAWRPGEGLIPLVENAVAAPKVWDLLVELPPSTAYLDGYEAEVEFANVDDDISRDLPLLLRGHEEVGGAIFVSLYFGNTVLRRAHIGGNHREPDGGTLIEGPHIHYPTNVFPQIGSRRARSRANLWLIPNAISLRQAIRLFAGEVNIIGQPQEQTRLRGGS